MEFKKFRSFIFSKYFLKFKHCFNDYLQNLLDV